MQQKPIATQVFLVAPILLLAIALAAAGCGGKVQPGAAEHVATSSQALTGNTLSTAGLQVQVLTNSCGANQMQDFFEVVNTGTTPVKLSDISIKFWADDTSGQSIVPHVWTGGCVTGVGGNPSCVHQVSGVVSAATAFAPACGPDATHQANWEITISDTDSASLPAGAMWSNIQSALNLANYSNFSPGTADWYSPCLTGTGYRADARFAVYFQGNLVFSNGISAPTCRSPRGQQQLSGYLTPAITSALVVGPVPPSTPIHLAIGLPVQTGQANLASLVKQVSTPTSPSYRQYLTQDQFTARFAPSGSDYQSLISWAQSFGLNVGTTPNRLLLDVSGTVSQVEQALLVNMVYRRRPDGTSFFGPDREPSLNFAVPLFRISGLDNRLVATTNLGPNGGFASTDVRAAYASCTTLTGNQQSVGLFEFDGFAASDISTYECRTGLATCDLNGNIVTGGVPISTKLFDGFTGTPTSNANYVTEVTADIQMVLAMAPGLQQVVVFEAPNDGSVATANDMLNALALLSGSIKQFSDSWNFPVDANSQTILYELATQGQSFIIGSGDFGSNSLNPDPGDIRDEDAVTILGGTVLTLSRTPLAYQSETAWSGSAGGTLSNVTIPVYQSGVDMSTNGGSTTHRNAPDIAMVATSMYDVIGGKNGFFTGTSASAPLFAAFLALANQESQSKNIGSAGFVNPFLYSVGQAGAAIYNTSFNDIKDNSSNGAFKAVQGYDLTTGWGTPKCALLDEIGSSVIGISGGDAGVAADGSGAGDASGVDGAHVAPVIAVVATEGSKGTEVCTQGTGFTRGGTFVVRFLATPFGDLLSVQQPGLVTTDGTFTDFDPTFGGGASSEHGTGGLFCSTQVASRNFTVEVTDQASGIVVTAPLPNGYLCGTVPVQGFSNETPLPNPPVSGQRTCPLPPD